MMKNEFLSRSGSRAEILAEIAALAKSYTPEWKFTTKTPDAGSVIAMIYAAQIEENINRFGLLLSGVRTEFANLLGLSLAPASPAIGTVAFSLSQDTVSGTYIAAGSKLLGGTDGDPLVFETIGGVYVSNARISEVIAVSGRTGKIIPLHGRARACPLLESDEPELLPAQDDGDEAENAPVAPFCLFDFSAAGISQNCLVMLHAYLFRTPPDVPLLVKIEGNESGGAAVLADPLQFEWLYYGEDGLAPFDSVRLLDGGCIALYRSAPLGELLKNETAYSCVAVRARGAVQSHFMAKSPRFSSRGPGAVPDFVCHNDIQLDTLSFMPFGRTASLYDECYIGCEQVFSQCGSHVSVSFDLSFQEQLVTFAAENESEDLRPIKRKPVKVTYGTANTAVHQVLLEYFNGLGWNRLPLQGEVETLFSGENTGRITLAFLCPADLRPAPAGGLEGRCIRMRVARADNCYMQPCIHKMPVLDHLLISYEYGEQWFLPASVTRIQGNESRAITHQLAQSQPFPLFAPLPFPGDSLLIGFDRPVAGAPATLYFDITAHGDALPIRFFYSASSGFAPLKVIDHTHGLSHSGVIRFIPPDDWKRSPQFGQNAWWIMLSDLPGSSGAACARLRVNQLLFNAAEVRNVEATPEQHFFIHTAEANAVFRIGVGQLLSADVFVNELPRLTLAEMRALLQTRPQDIRSETGPMETITEFYVRWQETDSLSRSGPDDRHYLLDRVNGTVRFGDGVHGMIPPAQNDAAVLIRPLRCNGEQGNLPPGSIADSQSNLPFIGMLHNPSSTVGGCSMESIDSACRRAASVVSARRRIVSELDLERSAAFFSSSIRAVRCQCGVNAAGEKDPRAITVAVLLREYRRHELFAELRRGLCEDILARCEMTVSPGDLAIIQPNFIEVSVHVWITVPAPDSSFELQRGIEERLAVFLDPVSGGYGNGWRLGTLPTVPQTSAAVKSVSGLFSIDRLSLTGRSCGGSTTVEADLAEFSSDPFAVSVSGIHKITVSAGLR